MVLLRWKGRSLQKWPLYSHSTFNTVWFLTNCMEILYDNSFQHSVLDFLLGVCSLPSMKKASYHTHNSWYNWERKKANICQRRHSISDSNSKIKCRTILHCWIELKVRIVQSLWCGFLALHLHFFVSVCGEKGPMHTFLFSPNE